VYFRWLQGGEEKIQQKSVAVQQRHINLPASKHVVCGTCGDKLRRRTSLNWLAPSPRSIQNHDGVRKVFSKRALFVSSLIADFMK
jgi:hypothetical protein